MRDAFFFFTVYSLLGWALESVYTFVLSGRYSSRKCFVFLPLCPVYGLGALGVITFLAPYTGNVVIVFLGGAVVSCAAEYLMHAFYERAFHIAFWDYGDMPLNLGGRVCLPYALLWGALSIPLMLYAHPFVARLNALVPTWLVGVAAALVVADAVLTFVIVRRYRPGHMPGPSSIRLLARR